MGPSDPMFLQEGNFAIQQATARNCLEFDSHFSKNTCALAGENTFFNKFKGKRETDVGKKIIISRIPVNFVNRGMLAFC